MIRAALLCAALALVTGIAHADAPTLTAPRVATGSTLGERLDGPARQDAAATTGFVLLDGKGLPALQPIMYVCHDADALLLGVRVPLPPGQKPISNNNGHDLALWDDDAVEVFVDPGNDAGTYYQFILNPGGGYWESRKQDKAWDAAWQHSAKVYADCWEAQLAIPWSSLGLAGPPPDGKTLGLNVAWDCKTGGPFEATWAPLEGGFHQPGKFGRLRLTGASTAARVTEIGVVAGGLRVSGRVQPAGKITISGRDGNGWEGNGEIASAASPGAATSQDVTLGIPREGRFIRGGTYSIELKATDAAGQTLLAQSLAFTVAKPLEVTVRQRALRGEVLADVDASGAIAAGVRPSVTASLARAGSAGGADQAVALDATGKGTVTFDMAALPAGDYDLKVMAKATGTGEALTPVVKRVTKPEKPWWLGSKEGITDKVYPPFVPLKSRGSTVLPWGREYQFGAGLFPTKVTALGAAIVPSAVTLRARVNGAEQVWQAKPPTIDNASGAIVNLSGSAKSQALTLRGKTAVEFDGMIRSDIRLSGQPGTKVDDLTLEIAVPAKYATYLYQFGGPWSAGTSAGLLPKLPWTSPFRPFLWLGDEDRGFCWFTESDRNMFVKDEKKLCEIVQNGDQIILKIHLLEDYDLKEPLRYTFGFEATPIRPNPKDVWDFKISHSGNYGMEKKIAKRFSTVTYPESGHFSPEQGTVEMWVRPQFDVDPPVKSDGPGRGAYNQELFNVVYPNDRQIGFYWNVDDRGMRVYSREGTGHPIVFGGKNPWKRGEWHHIALTWGNTVRLYQDGKETASQPLAGLGLRGGLGGTIRLGGGEFDVEALRISSVARTSFDLAKPLERDPQTLLLDTYSRAPKAPATIAGTELQGSPGTTDGKFAKAWRFSVSDKLHSMLDEEAELGVKTICFHEHWTDIQDYTSTTHTAELKSLVKACHEGGVKLLLYDGYEMADIAPEFPLYSEECLCGPRQGGYTRQPQQTDYIVCYKSKWQDFVAAGLGKLIDDYGIDGVYLDGTANPWMCENELHGCGYRRPDGTLRPCFPIFSTREMMKRIFNLVKSRKPDGEVNVHQSTCMTIPTIGFATSYWDGEQFGFMDRGPRFDQVLPLPSFRCEFMGRQWGVPAEFLCYDRPYSVKEAYAFTLQHDVLVRADLRGIETFLWRAMDQFGKKSAEWLPYWRNAEYVRMTTAPHPRPLSTGGEGGTATPDALAGLYVHKGKDFMAVISNLSPDERTVTSQFDLGKLGLGGRKLVATDVITGDKLPLDGEKLTMRLQTMGWKMVWVR